MAVSVGIADLAVDVRVRAATEVKAEALREAADALYSDDGPGNPLSVATWLRERADITERSRRREEEDID